jgi:hypothetical protein
LINYNENKKHTNLQDASTIQFSDNGIPCCRRKEAVVNVTTKAAAVATATITTTPTTLITTVCSESRFALRLRYVDLVVSIEVAVEVCCCFTVFSCKTAVEVQYR